MFTTNRTLTSITFLALGLAATAGAQERPAPDVAELIRHEAAIRRDYGELIDRLKAGRGAAVPRRPRPVLVADVQLVPVADDLPPGPAGAPTFRYAFPDFAFELVVFGDLIDDQAVRARLRDTHRKIVDRAAIRHGLNDAEVHKLRLAGDGDIAHLFGRVAEARREFLALRFRTEACRAFLESLDPLREEILAGPSGVGSFYAKTLVKLLADRKPAADRDGLGI